ncbi:MAG: metallophosphoesterase [Flavobacteriales bacterium]|nr:metallophosphoesterase [Flavobacteriales bacterium]
MGKTFDIAAISDTHCFDYYTFLPKSDIFISAGDLLSYGTEKEYIKHIRLMGEKVEATHKIYVPGNHDKFVEKHPLLATQMATDYGINLVLHDYLEIEGIKFFGSPYVNEFTNGYWAFERTNSEMHNHWLNVEGPIDILITHSPPYGILDACPNHEGSKVILEKVKELQPKIHIFGHIHTNAFGQAEAFGTKFYNVAWLNDKYEIIQAKQFQTFTYTVD